MSGTVAVMLLDKIENDLPDNQNKYISVHLVT